MIFQIANDAPAGDVAITVSYDPEEIYNKDSEKVTFAVQPGTITVEESAVSTPGNSDEEKPGSFFAAIAAFFEAIFRVLFFFLYL